MRKRHLETAASGLPPSEAAALLVAEVDTGGRQPKALLLRQLITAVALAWSLFQLWIASPLPFVLQVLVLNTTETRAIHLAFALFLGFLLYPAFKRSPRDRIPIVDFILAGVGAFCAAYLYIFYHELAERPGMASQEDIIIAIVGLVLLLEAARRTLGLPLVILAIIFLAYVFLGPYMPDMLAHKAISLRKGMSHLWLGTEGVFGVALGVSTSFIFLFVLFGALLEATGAGNYFIQSAISMLGGMRGGPAKAAVLASAATGMVSGSSIANVVTTGTFTIPLMKRVGYRADKAGAVEAAASVDGQIMPPVMGAAAFLMVEYVGIPYTQVIKHALLPALISYLALFYIVHLEALKAGIEGLPRAHTIHWRQRLLATALTFCGLIIIAGIIYYGFSWVKTVAGDKSIYIAALVLLASYIALLKYSLRFPSLAIDDPNKPLEVLPDIGPTLKSGLYFLLPVIVLIWSLIVEQLSPALSAFWATLFLIVMLLTQRPIRALLSGQGKQLQLWQEGLYELRDGLVLGARNMISIAIATAAAGIIVGTVTLTGVGLIMTEIVEIVSGGQLMIMLAMVAIICLILGMGLPTTASYIVVSTLMAPVVVELGAQHGLLIPLIAVHLFVFYFGLMADVTPPVGLAAYAAAGIARTDPIRTGITAFGYSIRTAVLPFMFIFNTQLLLIDIESPSQLAITVATAIAANLLFVAATQGWLLLKNRWYESLALLLITFSLFRPGYWLDLFIAPYESFPGSELHAVIDQTPADQSIRIWLEGTNLEGDTIRKGVLLPLGNDGNAQKRLEFSGLRTMPSLVDDGYTVMAVSFGSAANRLGVEQGYTITHVDYPVKRPSKNWFLLPFLLLLGLIIANQRRRARRQ